MSRPESIENRWDILYRDYPEVYEAFSNTPYHPTVYEQLPGIIDMQGKSIADVGAGTGSSSLALARYAQKVIGIERERVERAFPGASDLLLRRNGSIHLNLWEANAHQLRTLGVSRIEIAGLCTSDRTDEWYSWRREKGKTGRFAAIISLR